MTTLPLPSPDLLPDDRTHVVSLATQYDPRLLGVPLAPVRLSWQVTSEVPDARQAAYQVSVRGAVADPAGTGDGTWTELDPVPGDDAVAVHPGDDPLRSRERREYRVRVATDAGWTDWSAPVAVEAGLAPEDLVAQVIDIPSEVAGPVPILRRELTLPAAPASARLHVSALGVLDMQINGRPALDEVLSPGWTAYSERVLISTVDVTDLLHEGPNAIAGLVGDGWYRGRFGFADRDRIYGERIGLLAQLEITLPDGSVRVVATDESWRGGFGAVRSAGIYDGTEIDLTQDAGAFAEVGFDDSSWTPAGVVPVDRAVFEPRLAAPVRVVEERPMARSEHAGRAAGTVRLDAGQNISGWVRLTVRGGAGATVTVRHAEILEPSGDLHTAALRTAKATDVYTLADDAEVTLEPVFTFHGFRYADVQVDGAGVEVVSATAVAISSDLAPRASFSSSHPALDQFHSNVVWSQRDNFVSVPTDCPQRDERLGWTGDAQAFAATASTLFDAETFWVSWLRDLEIDQADDGAVASVVPDIIRPDDMMMGGEPTNPMGRAGWADAATIVPLAVHESYGSTQVLEQQLGSMRRWVEHLRARAGDDVVLPTEPFQYGDWLDPDAPGDRPWDAKVSSDYVANAFYARSAHLLARAETIVGDADRAAGYAALARRVASATWDRWGAEAVTTQTGAALALEFDLAPDELRGEIARGLAANVRAEDGRIATGFLGTPLVLFALSRSGHLAEAYLMLLRREAPSWLYQVDQGATTVWERWDAIKPDGSIHGGEMDVEGGGSMLSFNHYAYGAMVDWVYRTVAGLAPDPDEPGYRLVHVAPRPAVGLDRAAASVETRLGRLAIDWVVRGDAMEIELTVPFGARAVLDLPVTEGSTVTWTRMSGSTIDGAPGAPPARLGHGVHRLAVSSPAVVGPVVGTAGTVGTVATEASA